MLVCVCVSVSVCGLCVCGYLGICGWVWEICVLWGKGLWLGSGGRELANVGSDLVGPGLPVITRKISNNGSNDSYKQL